MDIGVIGINLTAALVHRHEDRLYTTCGLRHEAGGSSRSNGKAGDVAAAILHHILVQLCVGLSETVDERIGLFPLGVEYLEGTTLLCHHHGRAIGIKRQGAMYGNREVGGLIGTITQAHGSEHVTLGGDADTGTAAHSALLLYLLPQMILGTLNLVGLWVYLYLLHDEVYLLHLQVDDVVHDALCKLHVLGKLVEVEGCLWSKRIVYIAVEIYAQQTARVVGTQWNLATGIGADRTEAQVGITVRNALPEYGVPEQYARLSTLPCVVYNLLPQVPGRDFLPYVRIVRADRELLDVRLAVDGGLHELIVNLHRDIGTSNLALSHLGVNERLAVGMLHANTKHQGTTTAILGNLACGVTISFHKRNKTCRRECGIVHRRPLRTNMAEVVANTTAPFHQLNLLLVDTHNSAIGVGIALKTYDEAVAQTGHLLPVADARHWAASRDDISEMIE